MNDPRKSSDPLVSAIVATTDSIMLSLDAVAAGAVNWDTRTNARTLVDLDRIRSAVARLKRTTLSEPRNRVGALSPETKASAEV